MHTCTKLVSAIALLCATQAALADNFLTTVTLGGITRSLGFASFDDAIKAANHPENYQALFPGVKSTVGADIIMDFKGLPIEFHKVSTTNVIVTIPGLGVKESVVVSASGGVSGSLSKQLDTKVENLVRSYNAAINKQLAKVDSADPIGGNPSSLMGIMVENAYLLGTTDDWSTGSTKKAALANRFDGGVRYGHYDLSGKSVDTFTMPLSYTFKLDDRQQIIVSAPFTYIDTQGAQSYDGGAGFAYKYRMNSKWVLTPAVAYSLRGSFDLADAGHVASGTLTSKYTFDLESLDPNSLKLTVGNMAGYYTTLPFTIKGYSVDPNLQNYIIKNGLSLSKNVNGDYYGHKLNVAANFTDTEYFGSHFFVDQYNELGISIKAVNDQHWLSALSLAGNYLFSATGKDVSGYRVSLTYQF
ncbi:MAG: hypothetical protein PHU14_04570 [Methylovulum sp.]|nr:hypothetical protein [Methylovulum sp.]